MKKYSADDTYVLLEVYRVMFNTWIGELKYFREIPEFLSIDQIAGLIDSKIEDKRMRIERAILKLEEHQLLVWDLGDENVKKYKANCFIYNQPIPQ